MKLLLVLDAMTFQKEQLKYPVYFTKLVNGELTVLFLKNLYDLDSTISEYAYLPGSINPYTREETQRRKTAIQNMEACKTAFAKSGIRFSFIMEEGLPLDAVIEASRFSDLLMISPRFSFESRDKRTPAKFTEEVLSNAQCPVLATPEDTEEIRDVIFTYNGTYSSVHAIKQFTRQFPEFKKKKVVVLSVPETADGEIPDKLQLRDYLRHHYPHVKFRLLKGTPSEAIFTYLQKQHNCIVTFGAYGRSRFSQFFKKSKAKSILKSLDIPVFITHP
jgi:nucleotide-binding universal stress UspA family protein